ncbi:MAG: serine--tRNA ligase, partial [Candidatus Brocadiia bacterium]|nr:serine--tRNA ligase [Candidatus Brocadiia bacterium]
MLDIKIIREQSDLVKDGMGKVGADPAMIDDVLALDERWRAKVSEAEELKAERKRQAKEMGQARARGEHEHIHVSGADAPDLRKMREQVKNLDAETTELRRQLDELLLNVPNLPHPDAPVGKDESENVLVRTEGEPPEFDFEPRPHWELGED